MPRITLHPTLVACLLSTLFILSTAKSSCSGYKSSPELDKDCRTRKNETACMQGYALRSANLSASCNWHLLTPTKVIDRQYIYNRYGSLLIDGILNQGSVCSQQLRVQLPTSATNRWGVYAHFQGGPQNTSQVMLSRNPIQPNFTMAGCTMVQRGKLGACTLKLTAPEGYAKDPPFKKSSVVMEFFTTDRDLIRQYSVNKRLNASSTLKFKIVTTGIRCAVEKPPLTPAVSDAILFGPSAYLMTNSQPKHYYLQTYRAYKVSNVTGASWTVKVAESFSASGKKTKMTSFIIRDKEYKAWQSTCNTTCEPPVKAAMPDTLCSNYTCTGSVSGLGGKAGVYRLFVSYPNISSYYNPASYSNIGPVKTEFNRQLVRVEIWPKNWALAAPKTPAENSTSSGEIAASLPSNAGVAKSSVVAVDDDAEEELSSSFTTEPVGY